MCKCKGKCGCNISTITKGEKGDNGIIGTNAFKFVKEFEYDGVTSIEILYSEITACNPIPEGCLDDGTAYNQYIDYHVQIWEFYSKGGGEPDLWILVPPSEYRYFVTASNGNVELSDLTAEGTYRLVILA